MTHNEILDELAKRGLIDGNIVERLSAAHRAAEYAERIAREGQP